MTPREPAGGAAPAAPADHKPIDAVALAKEVALDRLEQLLELLLRALRRWRAGRASWH
jgi:hypothetical protein